MTTEKVSIILPTFNEVDNIVDLIKEIIRHIPNGWQYEVIVVDDDSSDGTYEAVQVAFKGNNSIVPILRTAERGLAKSIREGITRAGGDRVIVMDADFTHDPVEIPRLLQVGQIYDIVSGSRFCAGGLMVDTAHYVASMLYNWILRIILRTQVQDNLGGYFTASRSNLLALPLDEIFFGYGDYFFRLLHFAQKKGLTIVEIPAQYLMRSRGTSKSNFAKMICSYSGAALGLKYRIYRMKKNNLL